MIRHASLSFVLVFSVFVGLPAVFAETIADVTIPPGTSVSGCETEKKCYIPSKVTIDVGGTVTWTNNGTVAHTVTSGSAADGATGVFDSGLLAGGDTFSQKFDVVGEYAYHCTVHPWMEGIVEVEGTQPPLSIDASTSQKFYNFGQSIGVNGKIKNYDDKIHSGLTVAYHILDPDEKLVTSGESEQSKFGAFSFNFVAGGEKFQKEGSYSIQLFFGPVKTEIPMYFSGGTPKVDDTVPPKIIQPEDILVYTTTSSGVTAVNFEVLATDNVDKNVQTNCKPDSGYLFGIGDTIVKCTAKDSAGNFALPIQFTVSIKLKETSIPSWVKNVAGFWCQGQIDDPSFIKGIQYLIDNEIIVVPASSEAISESQEIPKWVKNNACWWSEGSITDLDFASGIQFLVRQGIIVV